jgi:hypothetical protein
VLWCHFTSAFQIDPALFGGLEIEGQKKQFTLFEVNIWHFQKSFNSPHTFHLSATDRFFFNIDELIQSHFMSQELSDVCWSGCIICSKHLKMEAQRSDFFSVQGITYIP